MQNEFEIKCSLRSELQLHGNSLESGGGKMESLDVEGRKRLTQRVVRVSERVMLGVC